MALQNFNLLKIEDLLEKKLMIPYFQREYSWGASELTDFWDDLTDIISNSNDEHFFGQIVIHANGDEHTIVDGQQRITTSYFFVRGIIRAYESILNDIPENEKEPVRFQIISAKMGIGIVDRRSNASPANLMQNPHDNVFFNDLLKDDALLARSSRSPEKKSQKNLLRACKFFKEKFTNLLRDISDIDEKIDTLQNYYSAFSDRFKIMYIEATDLDEAYTVFETLNARGKDLASADLLKNHLFSTNGNSVNSQNKWDSMIDDLGGVDLTKYIRHYWNSYKDFTRGNKLYKTISNFARNRRVSQGFLNELSEYACYYHDLVKPELASTFSDRELIDSLKGLSTLGASSFYPIVLAMAKRKKPDTNEKYYTESDIAAVVKCIECYVFRNSAICGKTANSTEVFFAKTAVCISNGELPNHIPAEVEDIKEHIYSKMVTDEEFTEQFKLYDSSNKERIRYIFRKIHKHLVVGEEVNPNNNDVHIEHIMPEDITQWPQIDNETHDNYLWRLGNLCLLSGQFNREISNKPFNDKKHDAYEVSRILPNNEIASYTDWGPTQIEDRQEKLSTIAVQIWNR